MDRLKTRLKLIGLTAVRSYWIWLAFPFIGFLVTRLISASMVDAESAQIHLEDTIATLGLQQGMPDNVGQTFISERSGLDSLTLWLADASQGDLDKDQSVPIFSLALYHSPGDEIEIYQANYRLPQAGYSGPFRIKFPPQFDPPGQSYYIKVTLLEGQIQVQGRSEDIYSLGQAWITGQSLSGDLAFSTTYRYSSQSLLVDLRKLIAGMWMILPLSLTLLLPGWLLLDFLPKIPALNHWDRLAVSAGISLAIIPLAMLWSGQAGLTWNQNGVKIVLLFLTVLAAWRIYQHRKNLPRLKLTQNDIAMTLIMILAVFLRLAMIRDLSLPAWVDSVHHALITRLVQLQGGFPPSYLPYFDIHPTAYHPGFHSGVAVFQWLSGLPLPESLLVYGQAINVIAVLSASTFAHWLTRSTKAACWAALAAGLLTPLPAYLTSWGRYTHLTGLIIFTAILALIWRVELTKLNKLREWIPSTLVVGLSLAGLILVHYRVSAFLVCWLTASILASAGQKIIVEKKSLIFVLAIISGGVLVLPWIIPAWQHTIFPRLEISPGTSARFFSDFDATLLTSAFGGYVLAAAAMGLIALYFRKFRLALTLSLWIIMMFLLANLGVLGLPGGTLVNHVSVEITLYIPIAMLAGYGISQFTTRLTRLVSGNGKKILNSLVVLAGMFLAWAGFMRLLPILNPSTVLAHAADLPAIDWISHNIPIGETIAINPFSWGYGLYAGNDGGYWITPLTGHPTIPPSALYGMGDPISIRNVQIFCEQIQIYGNDPSALRNLLDKSGIEYLYIGSRGGTFSPQALNNSPLFQVLYHRENTWVFQRKP